MMREGQLFEPDLPEGFRYAERFLSEAEEAELVERIGHVRFSNFEMRGVVARRRVAFFGASYRRGERATGRDEVMPEIPGFLLPLRARAAAWANVAAEAFAMALINQYQPGAPIGWHRDAPQYDIVAGISLLSSCRMKLRPYVSPAALRRVTGGAAAAGGRGARRATHELLLAPRSIYLIAGPARTAFEHSIPPVDALRYSITFRTLRPGRA